MTDFDRAHMLVALGLARRGLGRVWPNPAVGCVLVAGNRVVGRGWTQPGGRPHAETEALAMAGSLAKGSTAYVTLEPCSHHGKTPPCAQALIEAGVARVVVATEDPDPRVSGRGIAMLRQAGIPVDLGLCRSEADEINVGFFKKITHSLPVVTLKLASSLDGRIATHRGESQWITGPQARAAGHLLRAEHDVIMVGSGTVISDDPELTCRLPGLEDRSPVRVVVDGRLRLPLTSRLVMSAHEVPTWVLTQEDADSERMDALAEAGVDVVSVTSDDDHQLDLTAALTSLADSGVTRVLVEGGARLAASLLQAGLVDRLVWFHAPSVMGGDGLAACMPFGVDRLEQMAKFQRVRSVEIGPDVMGIYSKI